MSFLFARADSHMAIVASETRFINGSKPGDPIASDGDAFMLKIPLGGPRIAIPASPYRNVRPIGDWHPAQGGWMTGTMQSPCLQLVYDAIQHFPATDLDQISRTVRAIVDRYRTAGTDDPIAPLDRGRVHIVYASMMGLTAATVFGSGEVQLVGGVNVPPEFSLPPNGVKPEFQREVLDPIEATWQCEPSLMPRLRAIGEAFQRCYEMCGPDGTCNNSVEVGVLRIVDTPGRWRLQYDYLTPRPSSEVACSTF
jgi:hypothetical protein